MLALDARLAGVVRAAREPILAQLRLAWWRDRLTAGPAGWPRGEPVLAALTGWGDRVGELVALVDGWEALLGEPPLAEVALVTFAGGRAAAMAALAGQLGLTGRDAAQAGRQWALADLALHLDNPEERAIAAGLVGSGPLPRLPRPMRALSVLAGLSLRAARQGRREALDGPRALLAAIRLGISGR